jgi:hypothetical protein
MNQRIAELIERIRVLQDELEAEFAARRAELRFHFENRRVRFEREVLRRHRQLKTGLLRYLIDARLSHLLSAPVIYGMIAPLLALDICISFYQMVCFPIYGIPKVRREDYFVYDREQLPYLNLIEKLNCGYCTYGNGLIAYVREIVARTEQYWCPIKHARRVAGSHGRYANYVDYGDAEAYHAELEKLRKDWQTRQERRTPEI